MSESFKFLQTGHRLRGKKTVSQSARLGSDRMVLSLPEGRVENNICPGWVGSLQMFLACLCRRVEWIFSNLGGADLMIHCADLITRCRFFLSAAVQLESHTVQQEVKVDFMVQRYKFTSSCLGVLLCRRVLKKKSLCWACLIRWKYGSQAPSGHQ